MTLFSWFISLPFSQIFEGVQFTINPSGELRICQSHARFGFRQIFRAARRVGTKRKTKAIL